MSDSIVLGLLLILVALAWGFVHFCAAFEDPGRPPPREGQSP